MKLWEKGYNIDKEIEKFTVGNDFELDKKLVPFDCDASIAHATMLCKIDIISDDEKNKLIATLNEIKSLSKENKFNIELSDEDCHTAIEKYLTSKLGNIGKKIHTCRSRNDQVLTAMRLYEKHELAELINLQEVFVKSIMEISKSYKDAQIPGYTHMQKAMPTTISTWLNCFADSMMDNIFNMKNIVTLIDQSPLGSAAGFGVPLFDIDKKFSAKKMGFPKVQNNPIYCQHSRGKFEVNICNAINMIMFDFNKISTDLMMYSMQEFNFVSLAKEFCTGSSIMPQKNNPDVLELVRAKYHITISEEMKLKGLISNLISGYNRDLQLTKEPVMNTIETCKSCLKIMISVINNIEFKIDTCKKAMTPELYATEEAYNLVKSGKSFRDAYKEVGKKFADKN